MQPPPNQCHGQITPDTSASGTLNTGPPSPTNARLPSPATSTPGTLRRRPAMIQAGVASAVVVIDPPRRAGVVHLRALSEAARARRAHQRTSRTGGGAGPTPGRRPAPCRAPSGPAILVPRPPVAPHRVGPVAG